MRFVNTDVEGAFILQLQRIEDERGFFARTWCQREAAEHGLNQNVVQCNVSFNPRKGTLRGMHYQAAPYEEAKLIRCTRGAIYDVIIDLRPWSPSYGTHVASNSPKTILGCSMFPMAVRTGFSRWSTARKCSIKCRSSTSPKRREACAGTILLLGSSGLRRLRLSTSAIVPTPTLI